MRKNKKEVISKNYLEKIPMRPEGLQWSRDEKGMVSLDIENKGVMNRIFQVIAKKPKVTHIHLDEMGSFLWPLLDGEKDILALGELVEAEFGEKAHPLYERLAKYFQILDSYHFIQWKVKD